MQGADFLRKVGFLCKVDLHCIYKNKDKNKKSVGISTYEKLKTPTDSSYEVLTKNKQKHKYTKTKLFVLLPYVGY